MTRTADAHVDRRLLALAAVFVTSLITAQIVSSKLIAIGAFVVPGGTLAYAFTFWASDCIGELYGEQTATSVVRVAFGMNFVLLALVWATVLLPGAGGVDAAAFESVLAPSTNIVLGSLVAYLVSQHADVRLFHAIRRRTGSRALWSRNVGSTAIAQGIDTVLFTTVAFIVAPTLLGLGSALPLSVVASLIVAQYVIKLGLAVLDTPLVYATVGRSEVAHG